MANFIISPYAISFESIRNNLQNYIANKPDADTWKDFFAASAGQTVLEIASALGAFYAYQFLVGRREAYLATAQNYSSILGNAQNLGYSASRGHNLQVMLNIVPNQTVTLSKWSVIGSYVEYDIVLTEDIILNEGIAINVPVIIGDFVQETFNVETNKLTQFTFANPNVTDTCRLVLNDKEVPSSTNIIDAINDKYIMISNVYGSVDVFYLNTGMYKYMSKDKLYLQFIERNNLAWSNFANSNLNIDYASQVNETNLISDRTDKESADNIKIKAPIWHETAGTIKSRKDYPKYLLTKNPDLIDANDRDITPGLIEITYIKNDFSTMSLEEKQYWLDRIEEARPSGVARATISDPIQVEKKLSIQLWKSNTENISSTISNEIDTILNKYENKLKIEIDLDQIEHDVEKLTGVKIARVGLDYNARESNTYYNLYDMIENDKNEIYYVGKLISLTGNTEPIWNTSNGSITVDNEIMWEKVNKYDATVIDTWQPNTHYDTFSYIKVVKDDITNIYVCKGYINTTGSVEPSWGDTIVYDNKLVWSKIDFNDSYPIWIANTIISVGDTITVDDSSYRCVSFRGLTSDTEPDWENVANGIIVDGNIQWTLIDVSSRKITLNWNEYIKLSKEYMIVG